MAKSENSQILLILIQTINGVGHRFVKQGRTRRFAPTSCRQIGRGRPVCLPSQLTK